MVRPASIANIEAGSGTHTWWNLSKRIGSRSFPKLPMQIHSHDGCGMILSS